MGMNRQMELVRARKKAKQELRAQAINLNAPLTTLGRVGNFCDRTFWGCNCKTGPTVRHRGGNRRGENSCLHEETIEVELDIDGRKRQATLCRQCRRERVMAGHRVAWVDRRGIDHGRPPIDKTVCDDTWMAIFEITTEEVRSVIYVDRKDNTEEMENWSEDEARAIREQFRLESLHRISRFTGDDVKTLAGVFALLEEARKFESLYREGFRGMVTQGVDSYFRWRRPAYAAAA